MTTQGRILFRGTTLFSAKSKHLAVNNDTNRCRLLMLSATPLGSELHQSYRRPAFSPWRMLSFVFLTDYSLRHCV